MAALPWSEPCSKASPTTSSIHANHVELVRGPLLYPDPGPVACMPVVLRWLKADREKGTGAKPWQCSEQLLPQRAPGQGLGICRTHPLIWSHARERVRRSAANRRGVSLMSRTVLPASDASCPIGKRAGQASERALHPLRHRDVGAIRLLHGSRDHDALSPARRVRLVQNRCDQALVDTISCSFMQLLWSADGWPTSFWDTADRCCSAGSSSWQAMHCSDSDRSRPIILPWDWSL